MINVYANAKLLQMSLPDSPSRDIPMQGQVVLDKSGLSLSLSLSLAYLTVCKRCKEIIQEVHDEYTQENRLLATC